MAGLRGAGKVYVNPLVSGSYQGYLDMANVASFAISNSGADTKTIKSTNPANYGSIIGSSTTPGDDKLSLKLNVPNRKNLTSMFLGTDTTITTSGSSILNESITVIAKDTYIALAHRKIATSPAPVVTNSGNTVTYVEGSSADYVIDYDNGLLYVTPASTIAAGVLLVDYTWGASSGYKIEARTQTNIIGKFLFTGKNLDSGELIRLWADSVELSPDGDFSLISADGAFLEFGLTGTIKLPTGYANPYTVEVIS